MGLLQVLTLWARADMGLMLMKRNCTFSGSHELSLQRTNPYSLIDIEFILYV